MSRILAPIILTLAMLFAQPGPQGITINEPVPHPPPVEVLEEELPVEEISAGQILLVPRLGAHQVVHSGRQGRGRVALTFDAGWDYEPTEALLETLAQLDVRATFFLRGGWMVANSELVEKMVAAGHEIGNHSWTHRRIPDLGNTEAFLEFEKSRDLLQTVAATHRPYYRPPYGEYSERDLYFLSELGYRWTVMWSVDSLDWTLPGVSFLINRLDHLQDGGIALFHVGVWETVDAMPIIVGRLRARGLEPSPITDILDWASFPMEEYLVQEGETIEMIAELYQVEPAVLRELNGLE